MIYDISGYIERRENCLMWTSFISQLVHPVGGRDGVKGVFSMGSIVILVSCKYYFIRVHENLAQHPSINKSINPP